jgi:hypothetical protein
MSGWKFSQYATMTFTAMLLLTGCVTQRKYDALEGSVAKTDFRRYCRESCLHTSQGYSRQNRTC